MFGLDDRTLNAVTACLRRFPEVAWVKVYGSRALGTFLRGSDIDLAFSSPTDCAAALLDALDTLPTPYLFDVTHVETLQHEGLRSHIDRVGVMLYRPDNESGPKDDSPRDSTGDARGDAQVVYTSDKATSSTHQARHAQPTT